MDTVGQPSNENAKSLYVVGSEQEVRTSVVNVGQHNNNNENG